MFQFLCKDLGITNLDPKVNHVITGSTIEEVVKKGMDHARAYHGDTLKPLSSPTQMADMEKTLRSKITGKP